MGGKSSAGDPRFIVLAWRQARRARACKIKSKVSTVVKFPHRAYDVVWLFAVISVLGEAFDLRENNTVLSFETMSHVHACHICVYSHLRLRPLQMAAFRYS